MILGIDAGGTNVDAVAIDDGEVVAKQKVPNNGIGESVVDALSGIRDDWSTVDVDRIVVATTIVVNAAVQDRLPRCTSYLIPGPGLDPSQYFYGDVNEVLPGCVDHRGRVTEEVAFEGSPDTPVVAITAKFANRNPELERDVRDALSYDDGHVALGNESGPGFTFPERVATTVANAKTRPAFVGFGSELASALSEIGLDAPVYYLKGDGAMLAEPTMRKTPAQTLRCGAAASTLGLLALSDVENAICVDVGGTTTDVARVSDGFLRVDSTANHGPIESMYDGVTSKSLPLGGDTRIERGPRGLRFTDRREGNAAAFGGETPTLTDALHVTGVFEDGDVEAARTAFADLIDDDELTDDGEVVGFGEVIDDSEGSEGDADVENGEESESEGGVETDEEVVDHVEYVASAVIDRYVDRVATVVDDLAVPAVDTLVVGGVLAPHLAARIAARSTSLDRWHVPPFAEVAGAIGCGVARVSLEVELHVDSQRGVMTVTSIGPERVESIESGRTYSDAEIEEIALERAREATRAAGGDTEYPCEIRITNRFNVVQYQRIVGEIVDVRARTVPGFESVSIDDSQ